MISINMEHTINNGTIGLAQNNGICLVDFIFLELNELTSETSNQIVENKTVPQQQQHTGRVKKTCTHTHKHIELVSRNKMLDTRRKTLADEWKS